MKKPIIIDDLIANLKNDPEYQERIRIMDEARLAKVARLQAAERPLVDELRSAGIQVDSIDDLVNTAKPYPRALPILLENLRKPYPNGVREGILRAMAVKDAKFAWEPLKRMYRNEPDSGTKDGFAIALSGIADSGLLDDVIALIKDRGNGPSRLFFTRVLSRSRDPRALEALVELKDDPDLEKEIKGILKRKKSRR
jgi:hypothetical protein